MADPDEPRRERASIPGLARQLVGGIMQLARLELTRARQEIGGMLAETRLALVLFGIAAALGFLVLVTLDVAVVLGTAALFAVIADLLVVIVIVATFTAVVVLYVLLGAGGVMANPLGAFALHRGGGRAGGARLFRLLAGLDGRALRALRRDGAGGGGRGARHRSRAYRPAGGNDRSGQGGHRVGETLAETRLEVDAQREELQRRVDELRARVRHALDIRAQFKENPVVFVGVAAGTAFLVAGGPMRVARLVRRRLRPSTAEQAYDALPKSMQAWVDTMAGGMGPRAARARRLWPRSCSPGACRDEEQEGAQAAGEGDHRGHARPGAGDLEGGRVRPDAAVSGDRPPGRRAVRQRSACAAAHQWGGTSGPGARAYSGFSTLARAGAH